MPRRHTQREKATAVATAERLNSSELAGKKLRIAPRTIRRWRDDPLMADIVRKTREETAEDVSAVMVMAWVRLMERLQRDEVETRDLIILAGVSTEKAQLLAGHATSRAESRDLTDNLDDHESELIGSAIRNELARRSNADAAQATVEAAGETGAETPGG
jgi:hypothetical protein